MIVRKGNQWHLYPHKVRYTNEKSEDETNVTVWANPSKEWWTEVADKHEHITVHEFIDVEVTEEMEARFEEIKDMPEDFFDMYVDYVLTGDTSDVIELPTNHPFQVIRLKKENRQLKQDNTLLKTKNEALTDRTDFHEDLIAEMAMMIYP